METIINKTTVIVHSFITKYVMMVQPFNALACYGLEVPVQMGEQLLWGVYLVDSESHERKIGESSTEKGAQKTKEFLQHWLSI